MTALPWLLFQLRPDAPGFWLFFDILMGAGFWLLDAVVPLRWQSLLRVARWLLPPYLALLLGAISPQQMGLTGIDWETGLRLGLGFALAILALVGLGRLATRDGQALDAPAPDPAPSPDAAPHPAVATTLYSVLYHGCEQFHWCFQRAAVLAILMSVPGGLEAPAYWSIWAATLLALPGVFMTAGALNRIYKAVALVSTAILFFYTRNFWLCWALHAGIMLFAGAQSVRPDTAVA